jgi:hypothetical protein
MEQTLFENGKTFRSPFAPEPLNVDADLVSRGFRVKLPNGEKGFRGDLSACVDEVRRLAILFPPTSDFKITEELSSPRSGELYLRELSDSATAFVEKYFASIELPSPMTSPAAKIGDPPKPRKTTEAEKPAPRIVSAGLE